MLGAMTSHIAVNMCGKRAPLGQILRCLMNGSRATVACFILWQAVS